MTAQRDLYDVLDVSREATQEEVKRAFRKLAMEYHPDRNKATDAEDRFKEVSAAYDVLSDPEKRGAYDRFGMAGVNGGAQGFAGFEGFGGFGDIFDAFFRGTGARRAGPQRGGDLRVTLSIDFQDAVFGIEREIEYERVELCSDCRGRGQAQGEARAQCPECEGSGEVRRLQQSLFGQFVNVATCGRCAGQGTVVTSPCKACRGRGVVRAKAKRAIAVPAGVEDGQQIRLSGEADAGQHGGPAGNLYVRLDVRPHKLFARDGDDLLYELPVNLAQAALGATAQVPTLDGDGIQLTVDPGTEHGRVFVLRGRGVPHLRGAGRGDLLVRVRVAVPKSLTDEQRALMEQLAESLGTPEAGGDGAGLFDRIRDAFTG